MNKRRAALINFCFSLGGLGVNVIGGIFFVPLYLQNMDDAIYGAWLASGGVIALLSLLESGVATVLTQRMAVALAEKSLVRTVEFAGAGIIIAAAVGLTAVLLGVVVAWFAPEFFDCPPVANGDLRIAVGLAAAGNGCTLLAYTLGAIPQALQQLVVSGAINLAAMIAGLIAIWSGIAAGWGVIALGLGPLCSGALMVIGHTWNNRRLWGLHAFPPVCLSWRAVAEIWREARSLLLARISGSVTSNLQAPAAALVVSAEASTVLGLTARLVSIVPLFVDRIGTAVFAGVARMAADTAERAKALQEILVITTVLTGIGLGLALGFTAPLMTLWVGGQRYAGSVVLLLLLASAFLSIRQSALSSLLTAMGEIRLAARWLAWDALLRLVALVILAPVLGIPGIPLAGAVAGVVVVVTLSFSLQSAARIRRADLWRAGMPGFLGCLTIGYAWKSLMSPPQTWEELAGQCAGCALVMLVVSVVLDRGWRHALGRNFTRMFPGLSALLARSRSIASCWCSVSLLW